MDVGALFQVAPGLKLGASFMNVGGPTLKLRDVAESFPSQFRGGAALGLLQGRGLVALELDHADGLGTQFHAGEQRRADAERAFHLSGFSADGAIGTAPCGPPVEMAIIREAPVTTRPAASFTTRA